MNRLLISLVLAIVLGTASAMNAQGVNREIILGNPAVSTITLRPPASAFPTYTISLPSTTPVLGAMGYMSNAFGSMSWLAPGANNTVLQILGGIPTWQSASMALDDDFVRYNVGTVQSLATTAGGNFLFNVEYGTTNAASAAGARINSLTTLLNGSSTGLTVRSQADGTGTARGLTVDVSGGATQFGIDILPLSLSTGNALRYDHATSPVIIRGDGNVGIGVANPGRALTVSRTFAPAASPTFSMTGDFGSTYNPSAVTTTNDLHTTLRAQTLVGNTASSTAVNLSGGEISCGWGTGATASMGQLIGLDGILANTNTNAVTLARGIGVKGEIQNAGGTTTTASSFTARSVFSLSGTVATYKGLEVLAPAISGTAAVTNFFGIDIDGFTGATTSNTALRYNHATSPVIIQGNGNVAIGVTSTLNALDVQRTFSPSSTPTSTTTGNFLATFSPSVALGAGDSHSALTAITAVSNTAAINTNANVIGAVLGTSFRPTATAGAALLVGSQSIMANQNLTQTLTKGVGIVGDFQNTGGITTTGVSLRSQATLTVGGSVGTYKGLEISNAVITAGTLTNQFGIDIEPITGATTNTAFRYNHATSPFVITGDGNVGIGISSPFANTKLHLAHTFAPAVANPTVQPLELHAFTYAPTAVQPTQDLGGMSVSLSLQPSFAGTPNGTMVGLAGTIDLSPAVTTNVDYNMIGVQALASNSNTTRSVDHAVGVMGTIHSSGPITDANSYESGFSSRAATTNISNYRGLLVNSPSLTLGGTITNAYGIDIDPITNATTINTAFRYNHATSPFAISGAGNVGIGTAAPIYPLQITKGVTASSSLAIAANITSVLTATASNETLIGLNIEPTFSVGAAMSNVDVRGISLNVSDNRTDGENTAGISSTVTMNNSAASSRNINNIAAFTNATNTSSHSGSINGMRSQISITSSNTANLNVVNGIQSVFLEKTSTNTLTEYNGFRFEGIASASGTISTARGLHVMGPLSGTIGNFTGIEVENINIGTTRRAFYYDGLVGNDPVVISGDGRIGVGVNSTTPATSLDVDGGMVVRPSTTINVGAGGNVIVGNRSYFRLNPTANVNVGFGAGNATGQVLIVEVLNNGANQITFVDNAVNLLDLAGAGVNFTPPNGAMLMLIWNGTIWMEISRTVNN